MIPFRTHLFSRVTIVGVGLIGGSLGMAIKRHNLAKEVVGVSQKTATLTAALKCQAIDQASQDIKKSVNSADLVILAAPVGANVELLSTIASSVRRHCVVMDVGSTKNTIVQAAQKILPNPAFFVGSHPLAGSEKKGIQYAAADLFDNSVCVITPLETTHRYAKEKVKQLWTSIGTKVKQLSPEEHDRIMAYISHLPHLLAYSLISTVPQEFMEYAARGLKDTTRIASSSPQMWNDICVANSRNIATVLDEFAKNLSTYRKLITTHDQKNLTEQFRVAKVKRDGIE